MEDTTLLEDAFQQYSKNLAQWVPDGVIPVDVELLQRFGFLPSNEGEAVTADLTRYFHVIESPAKITLYNEQFVVWIVPENINHIPTTYVLVAKNQNTKPTLELAFSTTGIYNNSRIVLRVLEKFLTEIQENEDIIDGLQLSG
ncbi:MAG: hypothetical protein K0S07_838 [Chlamydiales bacterium]|jgi:hypothetical protein|nr:hypothetical protein [Chlamydiales bacterium]